MKDHPRLRGEYARAFAFQSASTGSPPLARGIPSGVPAPGGFARITPACAGNTFVCHKTLLPGWDHPRLRGEYSASGSRIDHEPGSPPLARGILDTMNDMPKIIRITPACAGNTTGTPKKSYGYRDHPRLRGEYKGGTPFPLSPQGSPPLARGILKTF